MFLRRGVVGRVLLRWRLVSSAVRTTAATTPSCSQRFMLRNVQHHVDTSQSCDYVPFRKEIFVLMFGAACVSASVGYRQLSPQCESDLQTGCEYESNQLITNWSATHSCNARKIFEPKSTQEVIRLLKYYNDHKMKLRPVGTALSPNGIGLTESGVDLITMANMNLIHLNMKDKTVTVGAGATVEKVLTELRKYGFTLENFSSIQEQQIAGWTQVAAHGTGCKLPTVEEQIVQMKLITPAEGILTLSQNSNFELFNLAKVGLGSLGVVTELTMRCVPLIQLEEFTACYDRKLISDKHIDRLKNYRHVRYMWLPYTDTVVSVCSNPKAPVVGSSTSVSSAISQYFTSSPQQQASSEPATKAMFELLLDCHENRDNAMHRELHVLPKAKKDSRGAALYKGLPIDKYSFADLRSELLAITPLDLDHVKAVNKAEASFWRNSQTTRVGDSTEILGFDCGGEQLVYEVCIPMGRLDSLKNAVGLVESRSPDVAFVEELLHIIEESGIPAPSPIEQRWTARSTAPMSPAFSLDPQAVFSWIGIIMYLPEDPIERAKITEAFQKYCIAMNYLVDRYNGQAHWAKIELPDKGSADYEVNVQLMRQRLAKKYPLKMFNEYRAVLDPHNVLSNLLIDELISKSPVSS